MLKKVKTICQIFIFYNKQNFAQHSDILPIKQVIETPRSDQSKINTVFVLNIDSFKEFKKKFAKANIADSYLKNTNNLSFMKHANAYAARLIALYRLALAEYIKANKDTLDEIQAKMKDTVLRNAIVWSNTSPQDVPNAMKQNNFTLHLIVTLPDL